MKTASSKGLQALLGIGISVGLLVWMWIVTDWSKVGEELVRVRWLFFLPALGMMLLHYYLRAARWRHLLPAGGRVPTLLLFDSLMMGNFATYVLPFRASEFVRPFVLSRGTTHSFSTAFVSVVIERFFDLVVVLLAFVAMVFRVEGIPEWAHTGAWILSALAAGILVFMVMGSLLPGPLMAIVDRVLVAAPGKIRPPARRFVNDFLAGAAVLGNAKKLVVVSLYSLAVWGTAFFLFYLFLLPFSIPPSASLAVTVSVIIALAVAAPAAPGFLGVYQTACIAAFALFSVSKETAVLFSLVTHVLHYLVFVVYGGYLLAKYDLNFSELKHAQTS